MVAWALPAGTPGTRYDRWWWLWRPTCVHFAELGRGGRDHRRCLWRQGIGDDRLDDPQRIRLPGGGPALEQPLRVRPVLGGSWVWRGTSFWAISSEQPASLRRANVLLKCSANACLLLSRP